MRRWIILPRRDEALIAYWPVNETEQAFEIVSADGAATLHLIYPSDEGKRRLVGLNIPASDEVRYWVHYGVFAADRFGIDFQNWLWVYLGNLQTAAPCWMRQGETDRPELCAAAYTMSPSNCLWDNVISEMKGEFFLSKENNLDTAIFRFSGDYNPFTQLDAAWSAYWEYIRANTRPNGQIVRLATPPTDGRIIVHDIRNIVAPLVVDARVLSSEDCDERTIREMFADHIGRNGQGYLAGSSRRHAWVTTSGRATGDFLAAVDHYVTLANQNIRGLKNADALQMQFRLKITTVLASTSHSEEFVTRFKEAADAGEALVAEIARAAAAAQTTGDG